MRFDIKARRRVWETFFEKQKCAKLRILYRPYINNSHCINSVYLQIFDILPLYSTLHSHESQKIQFTFYGHANISSQAVARCSVHGGPDYDIELLGQASLVQYFFDRQIVDYGKQVDCSNFLQWSCKQGEIKVVKIKICYIFLRESECSSNIRRQHKKKKKGGSVIECRLAGRWSCNVEVLGSSSPSCH